MQSKILHIVSRQFIQKRCYKKQSVRVRFAPSPTGKSIVLSNLLVITNCQFIIGHLHLGGLRTALYNYLFARQNGGSFLLRIEDTDRTRLEPEAIEKLQADLLWAGIISDEDPVRGGPKGPYLQSKRLDLYNEQVTKLLDNGSAYYCFCSEHRLDLLRRAALRARLVPKYDNRCRHLDAKDIKDKLNSGDEYCIRFKLSDETMGFNDLVYGDIPLTQQEGDPVIIKTDKYPTYHFANVVDDHFMEISHVLRGVEWQISTHKHIQLYNAFGWTPPKFAHLPLILNSDGSKLSKRQGHIKVDSFRKDGIFPLALINYITQAGGGFNRPSTGLACYSYAELIQQFDITRINTNSSKLRPDDLLEFNKLAICELLNDESNAKFLVDKVRKVVVDEFPDRVNDGSLQLDDEHIIMVLKWAKDRMAKLQDLVGKNFAFLWVIPTTQSIKIDPKNLEFLKMLSQQLAAVDNNNFDDKKINDYLKEFSSNNDLKFPAFMKLLRSILSGLNQGPPVGEMMSILGKQNTLKRINRLLG